MGQEYQNSSPGDNAMLKIGDDVELAQYLAKGDLRDTVYCEDEFWRYDKTHWRRIPKHEMSAAVRKLSGMKYGIKGVIGLSAARIKSVLEVLADILAQPDFFTEAAQGINAATGFITFDDEFKPKLVAHSKEHCQRMFCPGTGMNKDWPCHQKAHYSTRCWQGCFAETRRPRRRSGFCNKSRLSC